MTASLEPPCPFEAESADRMHTPLHSAMIYPGPAVNAAHWLSDACRLWTRPANDPDGSPAVPTDPCLPR